LGIGDWGLGIAILNPQSPIPNNYINNILTYLLISSSELNKNIIFNINYLLLILRSKIMDVPNNQNQKESLKLEAKSYKKIIVIVLMVVILFFSQIKGVKADFGETIAAFIFYCLITVFICAGIGWWQRRQEGYSGDSENK